jgi:branched-chain amino acid transport system permease protein
MNAWYSAHYLLLILVVVTAISGMSYQVALRSGQFALISAAFWGVGAYAAGDIAVKTTLPWPVGIALGLGLSALGGLALSFLLSRVRGLYLGMATLAFDLVIGVIAQHATPLTGGAGGLSPIPTEVSMLPLLIIFIVTCSLMCCLEVARPGRSQEVIHFDSELATSVGVNVRRWQHIIFALAGVLGALSGSLYALTFYAIDPSEIGFSALIIGIATCVVGGVTSWRGCLIGAVIVVGFPGLFNGLQVWEPVIYGGLLLLAAVFLSNGLFGLWTGRAQLTVRLADARRRREGLVDSSVVVARPEELKMIVDVRETASSAVDIKESNADGRSDRDRVPPEESLIVDHITVNYGNVVAVDDLSLTIGPREICGLIGPNGSGKSTTIAAMSRLLDTASGKLLWQGKDYTREQPNRLINLGIARTFQAVRLVPSLSVSENVIVGLDAAPRGVGLAETILRPRTSRRHEKEAREFAEGVLERVGLGGMGDRRPTALSYGQQRRVELARALIAQPAVLMLDEPTAGMSEEERNDIGELLQSVASEGTRVLLVEHNVRFITNVCHWVYVMDLGKCIASSLAAEISLSPEVVRAYLGSDYRAT